MRNRRTKGIPLRTLEWLIEGVALSYDITTSYARWASSSNIKRLGHVILLTGLIASSDVAYTPQNFSKPDAPIVTAPPITATPPESTSPTPRGFSTEYLAGANLGDKLFYLTGLRGIIPQYADVDFKQHLKDVWADKIAKQGTLNPMLQQIHDEKFAAYYEPSFTPTRMSIDKYIEKANLVAADTKDSLDWNMVGDSYGLDQTRLTTLRHVADKIDGTDLIAYALTELMPTQDGELNIALFNYLTKNAGREYVESYPSLFDVLVSFGPYQFTKLAVGDPNIDGATGGASIINRALPAEKRIPDSVYDLKGDHHTRAALLFSIHNLASLLSNLNDTQAEKFANIGERDLIQYVATAHNNPASAMQSATRFLDNNMNAEYWHSVPPNILGYALKTAANFSALKAKHSPTNGQ